MVCEHRYHFVEFTPKNKKVFIDKNGVTIVEVEELPERYAKFVCEKCGDINNVLVDKTKI